jgi:hypothetical protein
MLYSIHTSLEVLNEKYTTNYSFLINSATKKKSFKRRIICEDILV